MRAQLLIPPIIGMFLMACGSQSGKREIPSSSAINHECLRKNNYGPAERMFYPFSAAATIKLVSFKSIKTDHASEKMVNNGQLDEERIAGTVALNEINTAELTDILYNYDYQEPVSNEGIATSLDPGHAIVFFDKHGKVFEYIELCFDCQRYRSSSEKVITGNFCSGKYFLLADFFRVYGLKVEAPDTY